MNSEVKLVVMTNCRKFAFQTGWKDDAHVFVEIERAINEAQSDEASQRIVCNPVSGRTELAVSFIETA